MPRNLELKAPLPPSAAGAAIARSLGAKLADRFYHTDTYFKIGPGRLKLREFRGGIGELIRYSRPNTRGVRVSRYTIVQVRHPAEVRNALKRVFGVSAVVRKRRDLYILKNARIHLDRVRGLGSFVEFEVIISYGMPQAKRLMNELKKAFGLRDRDCIGTSYSTLLIDQSR